MRNLDEIIDELLDIDRRINRLGFIYFGKGGFNPNQPRVPAGHPDGGQWARGGGASPYKLPNNNQETDISTGKKPVNDFGITEEDDRRGLVEESYLFENLLGVAGLIRGLAAWSARIASRATAEAVFVYNGSRSVHLTARDTQQVIKSMEKYLGGKPRVIINKDGDIVMMRGNKKIRFDINNSHGYDPHFQIEMYINGKWISVGNHHYYFKK